MSIKTNYNFKGIEVKDAIIRVDRLWGSSKENWTALVGVYNLTEEIVPATSEQESYNQTVYNKLEEFNITANFTEDERGYVSLYNSLKEEFGGTDC